MRPVKGDYRVRNDQIPIVAIVQFDNSRRDRVQFSATAADVDSRSKQFATEHLHHHLDTMTLVVRIYSCLSSF